MTDREWMTGWAELMKAGLNGWPTEAGEAAHRAALYRRLLDDLSGAAWIYAVDEALKAETWFPPVAILRRFAAEYVPKPAGYLVPISLERAQELRAEQREQNREIAKKGLALIRAEMEKRGLWDKPVKEMPSEQASGAGVKVGTNGSAGSDVQQPSRADNLGRSVPGNSPAGR